MRSQEVLRRCAREVRNVPGIPKELPPDTLCLKQPLDELYAADPPEIQTDSDGRAWIAADPEPEPRWIPVDQYSRSLTKINREFSAVCRQRRHLDRNIVTGAVEASETFLENVLREYFVLHPESAERASNPSWRSLLSELEKENAKERIEGLIAQSHVADLMKGNIHDVLSRLEQDKHLRLAESVAVAEHLKRRRDLVREAFARRHLYVHRDGIVDQTYIQEIPGRMRGKAEEGLYLESGFRYLHSCVGVCEATFLLLALAVWRHAFKVSQARQTVLMKIVYDCLLDRRWGVAKSLAAFAAEEKGEGEDHSRSLDIARINVWLCVKRLGHFEDVRDEVEAYTPAYDGTKLARLALLEDSRAFFKLLRTTVSEGLLSFSEVEEFPVFAEMRGRPGYRRFRRDHSPSPESLIAALRMRDEPTAGSSPVAPSALFE